MSNAWVTSAQSTRLGTDEKRRPCEKAVLVYLADVADEDGYCWPRVSTIIRVTELADSTVRTALRWLENEEYLERQPEYDSGGRQTSNTYRLTNLDNPPNYVRDLAAPAGGPSSTCKGDLAGDAGTTRTQRRNPQTEEDLGGASGRRRKKQGSGFNARPDDETAPAEESPDFGAGKKRPPKVERDAVAELSGKSLTGKVLGMRTKLRSQGYSDPVNVTELVKHIGRWDLPLSTVQTMIDTFVSNPRRYLRADEVPWTGFVRQREALKTDAGKVTQANDPHAKFRAG